MEAGHGMSAMCVSVYDAENDIGLEGVAAIAEGMKSCPALSKVGLESKQRGHTG